MLQMRIAILVFFTILLLTRALAQGQLAEKEAIAIRVRFFTREKKEENDNKKQPGKKPLARVASVFKLFTPKHILTKVDQDLTQADIPLKAEEMIVINVAAAVIPASLIMFSSQNVIAAVIVAVLGAYAPILFLKSAKQRRVRRFNSQLGDSLLVMSNSLRAGFSFLQAMDSLCRESPAPLSIEFGRVLREMRLGTTTDEALRNLADRIKSEDLELMVTAVNIQRQVGGNLSKILDTIAHTINERVRIKGEIKTLTAQGRISGIIVSILPVFMVLIISVINPTYISILFSHPMGIAMVVAAVVSECIGIYLIKRIVNVQM